MPCVEELAGFDYSSVDLSTCLHFNVRWFLRSVTTAARFFPLLLCLVNYPLRLPSSGSKDRLFEL